MNIPEFHPSIFFQERARIDSPKHPYALMYTTDKEFFKAHPDRSQYIRTCCVGEFGTTVKSISLLPPIHVLVTKLKTGFHMVMSVYVGPYYDCNPTSDDEITSILEDMESRNGIDNQCWREFCERIHNMDNEKAIN
jgi:hypothetical protein